MVQSNISKVISGWRRRGLILTSKEEGYEIYWRRENSTHCEKCNKKYISTQNRCMDHEHLIDDKWGAFRNILCTSCNSKIHKIHSDNTTGYSGISKHIRNDCKHGIIYKFRLSIDGKYTFIKSSVDKEKLIKFATQWKIDNNYNY